MVQINGPLHQAKSHGEAGHYQEPFRKKLTISHKLPDVSEQPNHKQSSSMRKGCACKVLSCHSGQAGKSCSIANPSLRCTRLVARDMFGNGTSGYGVGLS
jgi:hypothetical protein